MVTASSPGASSSLSAAARMTVLRFAASFLWVDFGGADSERGFLAELARELDIDDGPREVEDLLARPPIPEEIDPASVAPAVADVVRRAALRAIAADGRVEHDEMTM